MPVPGPNDAAVADDQWVYKTGAVVARDSDDEPRELTDEEKTIAADGFRIANTILLSACFKAGVASATMTHAKELSSSQVYEAMTKLPALTLKITFYDGTSSHGTIGWDDPKTDPSNVHMNRFFVKTAYLVADNLLHEAAHARGFIHKSSRELTSVPYMMNHIFEACASRFKLQEEPATRLGDEPEGND